LSEIGWLQLAVPGMVSTMRKVDEIAKPGDGLLPELRLLYEQLAKDLWSQQFVRNDGMVQSGPDPDTGLTTAIRFSPP
jgi:hypothetical protein